jgi:hypothetical protein
MDGTVTAGGNPDRARRSFLEQLLEIRQDPKVKALALRRAGDLGLADDALNEAYYAVARRGPEGIRDVRAYYCRTVINVANSMRYEFAPSWTEDLERIAESSQDGLGGQVVPHSVDETVCGRLLANAWLESFAIRRRELAGQVPGRSPDPARYRATIVAASEQVLYASVTGDVSDADSNPGLIAAYPEWFAEPGCAENTRHQRFSRARADLHALLSSVVSRDDLYP